MKQRTNTTEIILHHSQYKHGTNAKEIKSWHKQRGFSDIGYHYVILKDGTIEEGRDLDLVGAHCSGSNEESIGICIDGNFSVQIPLPAQIIALDKLVGYLFTLYDWNPYSEWHERIRYHRDADEDNPCPGVNFQTIWHIEGGA
jgi:hypothetical protein